MATITSENKSSGRLRLLKPLRREVRQLFNDLSLKIWLTSQLDPQAKKELERFKLYTPLRDFLAQQCGGDLDCMPDSETLKKVMQLPKSERPRFSVFRRELREQLCLLSEKALLLYAIDAQFQDVVKSLGFEEALKLNARWHAMAPDDESE